MENEKPWWWPTETDEKWIKNLRDEYPDKTQGLDAETIRNYFAEGWRYNTLWDHLGDARESYEKLADAFLIVVKELEAVANIDIKPPLTSEQAQQMISISESAQMVLKRICSS